MADDAPAHAGTDETAQQDSAHPGNGESADPGAAVARDDLRAGGRTPNGDAPAGGNGTAVADTSDPAPVTGLTAESTVTESLAAESLTTGALAAESLVTESLAAESPATESLGAGAPRVSGDGGTFDGAGPESGPVRPGADVGAEPEPALEPVPGSVPTEGTPVERAGAPAKARAKRGRGSFWRELPILVVIAVGLAILIRTFLVQAFFIPSGSMEKTLHGCPGCSGDRVLVNKLASDFRDPRPGDVVVFRGPPSWDAEVPVSEPGNVFARGLRWIGQTIGVSQPDEKDFVKRVIAVGGQSVACCDTQGRVTVNGVPLNEPYIFLSNPGSQPQEFGPVTVPKGRLWVMGDHRDGSADSRAHIDDGTSGTVPVSDVIGKAFVIVWPPSRWNTLGTPATFHDLSSGPLSVGAPMALGVIGTLPVAGLRRLRRRRRRRRGAGG